MMEPVPPHRRATAALLAALAVAIAVIAIPVDAQEPSAAGLVLRDRVLAVVDEDPILSSDVDRVVALGLAERQPGESEDDLRRRVLETLVEQSLRFHEASRFGTQQVPVAEIEDQVAAIRAQFPTEEEFAARLTTLGLTRGDLSQLVARQLMVLHYFEEVLGPRIFVDLEDIRTYYEEALVPRLEAEGIAVPPIETVREDIRALLREQRLNQAIERRTEELRREADVVDYFDRDDETLPPVVFEMTPSEAPPSGGGG